MEHGGSIRELPRRGARRSGEWVEERVRLARTGDAEAWSELVREFGGMLRAIARGHRLSSADTSDVVQTTWLRLAENLDRLENPARLGAWLGTTARHECLRILRASARELPNEQPPEPRDHDPAPVERRLLDADRDAALWSAFTRLPARDQTLLRMLVGDSEISYRDIGAVLEMPIGSIGPTRGRAIERLRRELEHSNRLNDLAA
jgi:RNA polymerase sigma factor (sigma-70 family)